MARDAITERMRSAAREFESAAIDAGFDFVKVEFRSRFWSLNGEQELWVFGIDANNKSHRWEEGNDGRGNDA